MTYIRDQAENKLSRTGQQLSSSYLDNLVFQEVFEDQSSKFYQLRLVWENGNTRNYWFLILSLVVTISGVYAAQQDR
jgi:hypothetical protein